MKDIYESTGLSKEDLQQFLKDPKNLDPVKRQMMEEYLKKGGRKTTIGIIVGLVCLAGLVIGFIYIMDYYASVVIEQTAPVPGDAARFDTVASFPAVKAHAGEGVKLISIDAQYVKPDGTMDLYADYKPRVEYQFYRETEPPASAPPVGAGSNPENKWYQRISVDVYRPGQMNHVTSMGGGSNYEYTYTNRGMDRDSDDPVSTIPGNEVPEPKCGFADLWKYAIEKGAPADAVAGIEYKQQFRRTFAAGGTREYTGYNFRISGTDYNYYFDEECRPVEG